MKLEVYYGRYQKKYLDYIIRVLHKLPKEVEDRIVNECVIFITGWNHGEHYWFFDHKSPIILNTWCMEIEHISIKEKLHVIAHEFAHHILGHLPPIDRYDGESMEKEANILAEEWGFPSYV